MNTDNKIFECCECGWTGSHDDKGVQLDISNGVEWVDICPNCENDVFYVK